MMTSMRHLSYWIVAVTTALVLGTSEGRGDAATLLSLGAPAGGAACFPLAVSADGTVAVGSCRTLSFRPAPMAFVWIRGQGVIHLAEPLPSQALPISVNAVSPNGDMVVGTAQDLGRGNEGYIWGRDRPTTGLGNAPGTSSIPTGLAPTGLVVGTMETAMGIKPFRWTAKDGLQLLPGLPPGLQAEVYGISSDGNVIVGRAWLTGSQRTRGWAFRWTESEGFRNLEPPRGDDYFIGSTATDVSSGGQVVVGDNIFDGRRQAFRWTSDRGMVPLGILKGEKASEATAISGDGRVVLGQSGSRPFWWDEARGLRDLRAVLETDYGMEQALQGWQLESVNAISADGRVLAGQGRNPTGEPEGWIIELR